MKNNKLGLDFGDVIVDSLSYDGLKFAESPDYLKKSYVPGALESILKLKQEFGDSVYVVSRVDKGVEHRILEWLDLVKFFDKTGIGRDQVFFVVNRSEKNEVCERLGITHFVDDRLEVLGQLKRVKHKYLFHYNPKPDEDSEFFHHKKDVIVVTSWRQLLRELLA